MQFREPFNEPVVNHQVFVKQPRREDPGNIESKDPDVWEAPTPKPVKKKSNWGGAARNKQPVKRGAGAAGPAGHRGGNPLSNAGYGNIDNQGAGARGGDGGGGGRRNYDKPWLPPEKEKKAEPATYAEHVYPDGIGPDTDLINMIERDALMKNPSV